MFLAAPGDREWNDLVGALAARVDLASDPRFGTEVERRRHDEELAKALSSILRTQSAAQWERDLRAADVACVEVGAGPFETWLLDPDHGKLSGT